MNKNYSLETKKPENQTSLKPFKPKFQMYSTLHKLERTIIMYDSRFLRVVSNAKRFPTHLSPPKVHV